MTAERHREKYATAPDRLWAGSKPLSNRRAGREEESQCDCSDDNHETHEIARNLISLTPGFLAKQFGGVEIGKSSHFGHAVSAHRQSCPDRGHNNGSSINDLWSQRSNGERGSVGRRERQPSCNCSAAFASDGEWADGLSLSGPSKCLGRGGDADDGDLPGPGFSVLRPDVDG
jgi:hypothetical protein